MEKFSYSKLDLFDQCPCKYKLRYIDRNFSKGSTLVLDLGTIAHKGKEIWGECVKNGLSPDYEEIYEIVMNGCEEEGERGKKKLLGINELKNKYFESFLDRCSKSNMNYEDKLKIYFEELKANELEEGWKVLATEKHFEIPFEDKCLLNGFIDRVDINDNGDLRVVDYKTSSEVYKDEDLKTPLQMFIYALACEQLYGKIPVDYIYDFVFLGKKQSACSKGYYNRGIKKLNKLLDKIEECKKNNEYIPKASPLCAWCDFSGGTTYTQDKTFSGMCQYYCLWTRENKTFAVNQKWGEFNANESKNKLATKEFVW